MQQICLDTSSFLKLRQLGCIYVDKTGYFHQLLTGPNTCFFLSRPRRFGKSLMITTLKAIFQGRRELFDGLAIAQTDWKWDEYPVIHLNLAQSASATSAEDFSKNFAPVVKSALVNAGASYDQDMPPAANFGQAIDELARKHGKGVVILIDEYDDPVARLLHKPDEAETVREMLATFYGQMKDRTELIRFLMITGVSKFTKVSVFSTLSNLDDLSFSDNFATMLGYTEEELDQYFPEHLCAHAQRMNLELSAYRSELKRWFNGYRFGYCNDKTVYNPVSINTNLAKHLPFFSAGWTDTGRPLMLMNFLKREEFLNIDMESISGVSQKDFDVTDIRALRTVPMLYQTGYLTIADFDPKTQKFTLCVPDDEVRMDLALLTATVMTSHDSSWISRLGYFLLEAQWAEFFDGLKALFASLPYGPKEGRIQEFSYERCLTVLLKSQGIQVTVEDRQANGQADIVAKHPCGVYVFELKIGESAEAALQQARAKGYAAPYLGDKDCPVWLIGLNFDPSTHQLQDTAFERA